MRQLTVRGAVVACLLILVGVSGAKAQDYYYTNFMFGYIDYEMPIAPCLERSPAQSWSYQGSAWTRYYCADGRDIQRRHLHVSDAQNPEYVPPVATTVPPSTQPATAAACSATTMIGNTGMNECEWYKRYPRP